MTAEFPKAVPDEGNYESTTAPWPTELRVFKEEGRLEVDFSDGHACALSAGISASADDCDDDGDPGLAVAGEGTGVGLERGAAVLADDGQGSVGAGLEQARDRRGGQGLGAGPVGERAVLLCATADARVIAVLLVVGPSATII